MSDKTPRGAQTIPHWPADKVERRPIAQLIPYARNARTHSDAQIAQIAASMREWGWTNPVLVSEDGTIIAGHGRVLAARQLGFGEAPVMIAEGWNEAQKRAYAIADNQLSLNAGWDMDTLAGEVRGLAEWGFDTGLLGFENFDALAESNGRAANVGSLAERFGVPPFSVLNAREGWWQSRKAGWLALGIQSELGRGLSAIIGGAPMPLDRAKQANAEPGGSKRPAADYSKRQRGNGAGRALDA